MRINLPAYKIAEYLDQNLDIKAKIPWWVRFGDKLKDPTDLTMVIRVVSDEWDEFTKLARIEAKLLLNRWWTPSSMIKAFDTINTIILDKTDAGRPRLIDWFEVMDIEEWTMFWPDYDLQDRQIMTKDYLFYYAPKDNG